MKSAPRSLIGLALPAGVAAVLLFSPIAHGQLGLPNAGTSSASIKFNDTNSTVPPAGTTNVTQSTGPWNGTLFAPVFPVDPNTADFASGDISASGAGATYSVLMNNIQLSQVNATAGFALLIYSFTIDYLVTGTALPNLNPTQFPNFLVSGTVGATLGSFASVNGTIDYYDTSNAAYPGGLLDTVSYPARFRPPCRAWLALAPRRCFPL